LVAGVILLLTACGKKSDGDTLILGVSADYDPFATKKQDKIVGLDIDIAQEIAKRLGRKLEVRDVTFASLIPSLQAGKIDMAMSGLAVTDDRKTNLDFSEQYYMVRLAVLYMKANPINDISEIGSRIVGVQFGSTMETYLKTHIRNNKDGMVLHSLDNNLKIFQELLLGRIDAVLIEEPQAVQFINKNSNEYDLAYKRISDEFSDGYAIAFKKGSSLVKPVNEALTMMKYDGSMPRITNKWLVGN
jgi:polar amino acid transport system substrate-binding protein